jgi:hypothetical protein
VSKGMTSVTRGGTAAMLGSGVMVLMTAAVVVLHASMFAIAQAASAGSPAMYLWLGTVEAVATGSAAAVLYRLQWTRITPARWLVLALGAVSALVTLVLWLTSSAA